MKFWSHPLTARLNFFVQSIATLADAVAEKSAIDTLFRRAPEHTVGHCWWRFCPLLAVYCFY